MLNPIEVQCPKCGAVEGAPCVGLRGRSAGQPLASGYHPEREEAARIAPDPDLHDRPDPELRVECKACGSGHFQTCGRNNPSGPFPVGSYHSARSDRAGRWLTILGTLSIHEMNATTTAEIVGKLDGALSSGQAGAALTEMSLQGLVCQHGLHAPHRWSISLDGVKVLRECSAPAPAKAEAPVPPVVSPLTPMEERALEADAVALALAEPDQVDVPCAVCGQLCSGEAAVYPTEEAEEEVPLCEVCAALEVDLVELRRMIAERVALSAEQVPAVEPAEDLGDPAPADVVHAEIQRLITCALPDDEIAHRALEIRKWEKRIEAVQADAKIQIKPLRVRIEELQKEIDEGEEKKVQCALTKDYRTGRYLVVRLDTGEVVEDRALTGSERQLALPIAEPPVEVEQTGEVAPPEVGDEEKKGLLELGFFGPLDGDTKQVDVNGKQLCPADPTCSFYGDGRCATPDGCCRACILDCCPDEHDHEKEGCPCPEAVRAAERARQGELKGGDDLPDPPAELADDQPF